MIWELHCRSHKQMLLFSGKEPRIVNSRATTTIVVGEGLRKEGERGLRGLGEKRTKGGS